METGVSPFWKFAAIVLGILLLLETVSIVWIFKTGYDEIYRKDTCSAICTTKADALSFYYSSGVCSCIGYGGGTVYTERLE